MDVVLKSPLDRVSGRVVAVLYSYIMIRICYIFLWDMMVLDEHF
jgi:hypothetical protein